MQLTLKEFEKEYGIKATTLRYWIFRDHLSATKVGRDWVIDPVEAGKAIAKIRGGKSWLGKLLKPLPEDK